MRKIFITIIALSICATALAADFTVIETERTERRIAPFQKVIVLEAGEKLANTPELLAVSQKTCPEGYKVTVRVTILVDKIEKL